MIEAGNHANTEEPLISAITGAIPNLWLIALHF